MLTGSHLFHWQAKQSVGFCLSAFSTFPASAGVARSLPLSGSAVKQNLCRLLYSPCLHNCCHSQDLSSYPSMPRLSWLVKLYGNLTYVRMRPAAIALNYSVKDIRHDVRQIIGASLSEPHTSESNGGFFIYYYYYYIYIYLSAVRTSFRKCRLSSFNPKHCARRSVRAKNRKQCSTIL